MDPEGRSNDKTIKYYKGAEPNVVVELLTLLLRIWVALFLVTGHNVVTKTKNAGLSRRKAGFAPGSVHVGIVVDKVALGQVFL
jgi:hypothetical protein